MNKKICYALLGILCSSIETGFCSSNPSGDNLQQNYILKKINEFTNTATKFVSDYKNWNIKTGQNNISESKDYTLLLVDVANSYQNLSHEYDDLVYGLNNAQQNNQTSWSLEDLSEKFKNMTQQFTQCKTTYNDFKSTVMRELYQQYVQNSHDENAKKSVYEHIQSLIEFINREYLECDEKAMRENQTEEALKSLVILQQDLYPVLTYIKNEIKKLTPQQQAQLFNSNHNLQRLSKLSLILKDSTSGQLSNMSLLFNQIVLMLSKPSKNINDIYRFTKENILDNVKNTYDIGQCLCTQGGHHCNRNTFYGRILTTIIYMIIDYWRQNNVNFNISDYSRALTLQNVIPWHLNYYHAEKQEIEQDNNKKIAQIQNVINDVNTKHFLEAFDILLDVIFILSDTK